MQDAPEAADVAHEVPFSEACRAWVRVAASSFGGPAGQIAVLHRVAVEEKRWVGEATFLRALGYCMVLPGPEAQQLATYLGWRLHGVRGGLVAGGLFILPGFLSILLLSIVYVTFGNSPFLTAVFYGLSPAVVAIVLQAVIRLQQRAIPGIAQGLLAGAAFVALFFFDVPFPLVIIAAAAIGLLRYRTGNHSGSDASPVDSTPGRRMAWSLSAALLFLAGWLGAVMLLPTIVGDDHVLAREATFFSRTAVLTFGGAYAVLSYVAQQAVEVYGWLSAREMLDGLGLAETTPGPLIQVVQFVGFLGAYRSPGSLTPMMSGVLGSIVTTWVTFAPSFCFIFAGAPFLEHLLRGGRIAAAVNAITAAVVGVVFNLTVWFGIHTLFAETRVLQRGPLDVELPVWITLDLGATMIAIVAVVLALRFRAGLFQLLGFGVVSGLIISVLR